ncbi:carboxylesterase [Nonomuraea longispora]|uniref:Carboxylic ester hydrolase n=1 Tax=Nonomuraea longispora TaxID=1848320 RepID=A0A4R4N9V1_9ACTN|nr:carboxylesterase family protein [Nonomuraea longispora]TDC04924.1 carboxylesterase [Nonomuraea longispora]
MLRTRFPKAAGVASLLLSIVAFPAVASTADDAVVRTSDGPVRGKVTADYRLFQGIPFAAPPVGARRWRAPAPVKPWTKIKNATKPGPSCPWRLAPSEPPLGEEDCLYLNVETPRTTSSRLPVMVFLHGGGFTGGTGGLYDPTRIVKRGQVVVVTLNYRLGSLGFLAHPGNRDRYNGNFGIADQQAALRWVRSNIAAFGGDPGNVTLWGESAGAFSACAQLAAPGAKGLFHKAIVQSGPCGNDLLTRKDAERRAVKTARELGCADRKTALACLRHKPLSDLIGLYEAQVQSIEPRIASMPWLPVAGTKALPVQPLEALRTSSVPLIHGGTRDEMRVFVAQQHAKIDKAEYRRTVRKLFGARAGKRVLAEYPAKRYPSPALALATLLGDHGGKVGACSQLPANEANRAPVFGYEFAEPVDKVENGMPMGVPHGADVRYFFDSFHPGNLPAPPTALHNKLVDYWTSFAKTGVPGPDWPAYDRSTVLSISAKGVTPINLSAEHHCGFWKRLRPAS